MTKIRSIEINDFRVYEGPHTFSFEQSGGISNLVVLYAPNGFGKTSFFDAVEWTLSGKIRRFEAPIIKNEIDLKDYSNWTNQETNDQVLLTNRMAHELGRSGLIRITLENNKIVQRVVKLRKVNNEDYHYDYRTGELSGDFNAEILASLVETHLLSQDQIDTFLRFKTPEDKFNMLKGFWPEGENATVTYKNIQLYRKALAKEKQLITDRKAKIEQDISRVLNDHDTIEKINTWINMLRENSTIEFAITPIESNINHAVYASMLLTNETYQQRLEISIDDQQKLQIKLLSILDGYSAFEHKQASFSIENNLLKSYELLSGYFADISRLDRARAALRQDLLSLENTKALFDRLMVLLPSWQGTQQQIIDINEISAKLLQENDTHLQAIRNKTLASQRLGETIAALTGTLAELNTRLNTADENFHQYIELGNIIATNTAQLEQMQTAFDSYGIQIADFLNSISIVDTIIRTARYEDLPENIRQLLKAPLDRYDTANGFLQTIEASINEKNNDLAKRASFLDDLNHLLVLGEAYVTETNTSTCPLCKTGFSASAELLNRIRADKQSVLQIDILKKEIEDLMAEKETIEQEKSAAGINITSFLTDLKKNTSDQLVTLQGQKNIMSGQIQDKQNVVNHASGNRENALKLLQKIIPGQVNLTISDIGLAKEQLAEDIKDKMTEFQTLSMQVAGNNDMVTGAQNASILLKNEITRNNNAIELLEADTLYKEVINLFERLSLVNTNATQDFVSREVSNLDSQLGQLVEKITENENQVNSKKKLVDQSSIKIPEEGLPAGIQNKQSIVRQLSQEIEEFVTDFKQHISRDEVSRIRIDTALESCADLLARLSRDRQNLSAFTIDLQLVKQIVEKNEFQDELALLNARLPRVEKALQEIEQAKDASVQYIGEGINTYFNKDTINKIYRRIEPHHSLNEIDFKPQVTDRSPTLAVKVKSNAEELNAVLYLSAGQVNVLSLSIFLAKAIETMSTSIGTIFMDDPIQNLSDINVLSFIDLMRSIITTHQRQIILSTHDEKFFKLIQSKLPPDRFNASYFQFSGYGKAELA